MNNFTPKYLWQLGHSKYWSHFLHYSPIHPFCNPIMPGCTKFCLLMANVMALAVLLKSIRRVLPAIVCMESLLQHAFPPLHYGMKVLKLLEYLTFYFQHSHPSLMWSIINKGDKISIIMQWPHLNRTTYIWINSNLFFFKKKF